jgi:hypothetical protein
MTLPGCWHLFGDSVVYLSYLPSVRHTYQRVPWSVEEQLQLVTPVGWRLLPIMAPLKDEAQQYLQQFPYYTGNEFDRDDRDVSPIGHLVGLSPHWVLQVSILASEAFRLAEAPSIADVRPHVSAAHRKPRPCRNRQRLVERLADALLAYVAAHHAIEELPQVRGRLDWGPITGMLHEDFDALADHLDDHLRVYRGERANDGSFDPDALQSALQAYPQLSTLTLKEIRTWLANAPAIAYILQALPAEAYANLHWPNAPWARSLLDTDLNALLREILLPADDLEPVSYRSPTGEQGRLPGSSHKKRVRRREQFQRQLAALKLVLYQGMWPHQSIGDLPLYEMLLLRMREAFLRYGSSQWPDTFIDHAMVKLLRQVGLEDLGAPKRIVDRLRKRIERFENHLLAALKALEERRRQDQRERHDSSGERTA